MGTFDKQAKPAMTTENAVRQAPKAQHAMPRKYRAMFGEIVWILVTAGLVVATYYWGLHAAIAAISACGSAMICRIIHYITMKERKNNGYC